MENPVDLLLINSLAPRQRSISDTALENSLAIIRTHLEDKGFYVEIFDPLRVDLLEEGVPAWSFRYLRFLIKYQMAFYNKEKKLPALLLMLAAWPIQTFTIYKRKKYIENLINNIITRIKNGNIPFVGIKVWYGDSFNWSVYLASRIKEECPETVVIAGGPQVNVYGEWVIAKNQFDLAIKGPGEQVYESLIELRKQYVNKGDFLRKVIDENNQSRLLRNNVSNKDNSRIAPSFSNSIIPKYRKQDMEGKILFHTIVDGFGCPWNKCYFCSHTGLFTHYKPRPVEQLVDEIKSMLKLGISFFRFSSSDTSLPQGKKIAEALLANNIKINYSIFMRPSKNAEKEITTYHLMIKSGLKAVFIGGETGHDIINEKVMNKGVSSIDIINTITYIRKAAELAGKKCYIGLALIYPCPVIEGVYLDSIFNANVELIEATMPDTVIINPPGVFPDTAWFEDTKQFGFKTGNNFIYDLMQYEYAMYKPPELWNRLEISLGNMDLNEILSETGKLRRKIASMGIPTEIADEYLMMFDAISDKINVSLQDFKMNALIDIVSGSTAYTRKIVKEINEQSMHLAKITAKSIDI